MSGGDHLVRRRHGAERVRDLRQRDDARARPEQLLVFVEQDVAIVVDRRDPQPRAGLEAELLPGHDIGVMFEPGHDDLVARLHVAPAPDCATRLIPSVVPRTNTISLGERGVEEAPHLVPRAPRRRRSRAPRAYARRGARSSSRAHRRREPVDHRLRLLRGRAVVEPDQPLAVHSSPAGSGSRCGSRRRRRSARPERRVGERPARWRREGAPAEAAVGAQSRARFAGSSPSGREQAVGAPSGRVARRRMRRSPRWANGEVGRSAAHGRRAEARALRIGCAWRPGPRESADEPGAARRRDRPATARKGPDRRGAAEAPPDGETVAKPWDARAPRRSRDSPAARTRQGGAEIERRRERREGRRRRSACAGVGHGLGARPSGRGAARSPTAADRRAARRSRFGSPPARPLATARRRTATPSPPRRRRTSEAEPTTGRRSSGCPARRREAGRERRSPQAGAEGCAGAVHGAGGDAGTRRRAPAAPPPVRPLKNALASRSIAAASGMKAPAATGSTSVARNRRAREVRRRHECNRDSCRSRHRRARRARPPSAPRASNRARSDRRRSPCD